MGGIAGFFTVTPMREETMLARVKAMTSPLHHRGPDKSGEFVDARAGIALGHQRLFVREYSEAGDQPMASKDGRYLLILDGEISNAQRLRLDLEKAGQTFLGRSDTEVMLGAIQAYGLLEALRRVTGMFAFAVWDRQRSTLTLARDRLGVKPLYYAHLEHAFAFGSELMALRAFSPQSSSIDRNSLTLLLRHGCVPAPYTIHTGVYKLEPGRTLTLRCGLRPEGALPNVESMAYWSAEQVWRESIRDPFVGTEEEALVQLEALLKEAVRSHMQAEANLGAFLSGGTDSSLLVALMQSQSSRPVRTFTVAFRPEGSAHSSLQGQSARAIATHLGTEHTELCLREVDILERITTLPKRFDEPLTTVAQVVTCLICELARRYVTIGLSAVGSEELFGGYSRYDLARRWQRQRFLPRVSQELARGVADRPGWSYLQRIAPGSKRWRHALEAFAQPDFRSLYHHETSHASSSESLVLDGYAPQTWLTVGPPPLDLGDELSQMTFWDLVTYLPDDRLTLLDRASMAVSLEARVPLLDHPIVEFAARLPTRFKVRPGERKRLLRQMLRAYVPDAKGEGVSLNMPLGAWLRKPLRDWAEALLHSRRLREEGYLAPKAIRRLWKTFLSGSDAELGVVWNVLMFQAWLEALREGARRPRIP